MRIVIRKKHIQNTYIFAVLLVTFIFGTMIAYNSMQLDERINNKLIIIFIMSILLLFDGYRANKASFDGMSKAFLLYCFLTFLAALIRGDFGIIASSLLGIIIYLLLRKKYYGYDERLYIITCLATITSCAVIIVRYSVESFNSQGIIICFTGIMLMNYLCAKRQSRILVYLVCLIIVVVLLSVSRSRTGMMAFLVVGVITYCYLFLRKWSIKNFIILLIAIMTTVYLGNYLINFFTKVFFGKWSNVDLTSNRINLWRTVWNNKSIAGHGINHISGDAHNAFMQTLGVSGWLGLIGLIALILFILYRIVISQNKIPYINFFSGWILVTTFENLELFTTRMIPVTVLFFIHILMLSGESYSKYKGIRMKYE